MIEIDEPDDPRLGDFIALTDRQLRREVEADRGLFIVEGIRSIEALLRSRFATRSVLTNPRTFARLAPALVGIDAPVYVVADHVMRATVGFDIHRGAVASAARPEPLIAADLLRSGSRLLVLEGVNDSENIGSLFRNAAAFGVDAVVLDPSCADPLYRRSVRVSLGHVLHLPFAHMELGPEGLAKLHDAGWSTLALTPSGSVAIEQCDHRGDERLALLLGSEATGLNESTLEAAQRRVRIKMAPGVDSLNVATAAAVALHAVAR